MYKYLLIAITLCFAFFSSGCEEEISGVSLPYEELLVINCMPTVGEPHIIIDITRTLPPLEDYDRSKAYVNDAVVTMEVNGVEYTAGSGTEGLYAIPYSVKSGDKIKLNVKWKNKTAYASTIVPEVPVIDSLNYRVEEQNEWGYYQKYLIVYAYLQAKHPEVCYQGMYGHSTYDYYDEDYSNIANYESRNSKGTVRVRTMSYMIWDNYPNISEIIDNYVYSVDAYDNQYYPFAKTYYKSYYGGDMFESNGTNPIWNIKGDGIGLFVARAKSIQLKLE